jgi:hypothetical protein
MPPSKEQVKRCQEWLMLVGDNIYRTFPDRVKKVDIRVIKDDDGRPAIQIEVKDSSEGSLKAFYIVEDLLRESRERPQEFIREVSGKFIRAVGLTIPKKGKDVNEQDSTS